MLGPIHARRIQPALLALHELGLQIHTRSIEVADPAIDPVTAIGGLVHLKRKGKVATKLGTTCIHCSHRHLYDDELHLARNVRAGSHLCEQCDLSSPVDVDSLFVIFTLNAPYIKRLQRLKKRKRPTPIIEALNA